MLGPSGKTRLLVTDMLSMSDKVFRIPGYGIHLVPGDTGYRPIKAETWYTKDPTIDVREAVEVSKAIFRGWLKKPRYPWLDERLFKFLEIRRDLGMNAIREDIEKLGPGMPSLQNLRVPGPSLPGLLSEIPGVRFKGVPWINGRDTGYEVARVEYGEDQAVLVYSDGTREIVIEDGEVEPVYLVFEDPSVGEQYVDPTCGLHLLPLPLLPPAPPRWLTTRRVSELLIPGITGKCLLAGTKTGELYGIRYRLETYRVVDLPVDQGKLEDLGRKLDEAVFWISQTPGDPAEIFREVLDGTWSNVYTDPFSNNTYRVVFENPLES